MAGVIITSLAQKFIVHEWQISSTMHVIVRWGYQMLAR
jgi:hypothetical protein